MPTAYISLGCNLGDCRAHLAQAVERLTGHPRIQVTGISSVYVTEPVGVTEQPDFLNMVAELATALTPRELFGVCRAIEDELGGRQGRTPTGPRTMDLDILLYEQVEITEGDLKIPHPQMLNRAFVLVPLAEIAPKLRLPGGVTVAETAASLKDPHRVEKAGLLKQPGPGRDRTGP